MPDFKDKTCGLDPGFSQYFSDIFTHSKDIISVHGYMGTCEKQAKKMQEKIQSSILYGKLFHQVVSQHLPDDEKFVNFWSPSYEVT